ncbi:hypothetical protein FY036_02380 [Mesorhizobium microcysteis]|uniref:Chemotaxis protein n=1 Tax=Neoaquamicrobium microcysteis TaxID=2682781 RepID=A0A5D4H617_9HYPH|nr:hypothetical protein FY036_02380 [Mesorhizobium microcysteis]
MLHVDIPTRSQIIALNKVRAPACVSIYLKTTPLTQHSDASRIELGNLARQAREQLEAAGLDKRQLAALVEQIEELREDDDFWTLQANSLAILATPTSLQTFRLANDLTETVQVSDRFHLKPLLRAITFPHSAFVLALSENAVRLVEIHADLPAQTVKVSGLPKDAASAVGKSTLNDRSASGRMHGSEGQNVRFQQYARKVDAALRPVLAGLDTPLILAATGRLASVYRSANTYPNLLAGGIDDSPDRISDADLAAASRPLLDQAYAAELEKARSLFEVRSGEGRATTDLSHAARAATFGAIDTLLVNIDTVVHGSIDETTGALRLADAADATSYGVVDEIAGRAIANGAKVLGVRASDLPDGGELAAILRFTA